MEQGVLEQQVLVGAGASDVSGDVARMLSRRTQAAGVKYRLVRVGVTASIPLDYYFVFNLNY